MSERDPVERNAEGQASGEVTERSELLDGSLQLALEGSCDLDGVEWVVSITLAWPLAEAGDVPLAEGDLALEAPDRGLFAVLDDGTASSDPDSGAADVTARFTIDATDRAEMAVAGAPPAPGSVECHLAVGIEEWRGELRFVAS